jgi:protein SCO1/2
VNRCATRVQVLFVTVDPERDTRRNCWRTVCARPSTRHFLGLYGDSPRPRRRSPPSSRSSIRRQPGSNATSYTVDHTAGSYVFDPAGRLRLYFRHGETPERMAQDLKRLLAGE